MTRKHGREEIKINGLCAQPSNEDVRFGSVANISSTAVRSALTWKTRLDLQTFLVLPQAIHFISRGTTVFGAFKPLSTN